MAPSWNNYDIWNIWNRTVTPSVTKYREYRYITLDVIDDYICIKNSKENKKKIKKLIRKAIIQKMKDEWEETKKEFKSVPKIRPALQLRCICFGGRGWA